MQCSTMNRGLGILSPGRNAVHWHLLTETLTTSRCRNCNIVLVSYNQLVQIQIGMMKFQKKKKKKEKKKRKKRWLPEQCRWKRPNLLEFSVRETGLETTGSCITTNLTHWGVTSTQAKTFKRFALGFEGAETVIFPELSSWNNGVINSNIICTVIVKEGEKKNRCWKFELEICLQPAVWNVEREKKRKKKPNWVKMQSRQPPYPGTSILGVFRGRNFILGQYCAFWLWD